MLNSRANAFRCPKEAQFGSAVVQINLLVRQDAHAENGEYRWEAKMLECGFLLRKRRETPIGAVAVSFVKV